MPGGRPSKFSQRVADKICSEIISGRSLNKICRDDDGMPSIGTVMRWLASDEQFQQQYARAKSLMTETMAEEIMEIADEEPERIESEFGSRVDNGHVQHQRNRVEARKWLMAKMAPKKYGESSTLEVSGPDGGKIQQGIEITFVHPSGAQTGQDVQSLESPVTGQGEPDSAALDIDFISVNDQ